MDTIIRRDVPDTPPPAILFGAERQAGEGHPWFGPWVGAGEEQQNIMNFRFYGSSTGRFLRPDNIVTSITNPQGWNRYSYVIGNPVNLTDPTGHAFQGAGRQFSPMPHQQSFGMNWFDQFQFNSNDIRLPWAGQMESGWSEYQAPLYKASSIIFFGAQLRSGGILGQDVSITDEDVITIMKGLSLLDAIGRPESPDQILHVFYGGDCGSCDPFVAVTLNALYHLLPKFGWDLYLQVDWHPIANMSAFSSAQANISGSAVALFVFHHRIRNDKGSAPHTNLCTGVGRGS